jgi:Protein of unknown function (DUF2892)
MKTYRNIGHHERVIRVAFGLFLLALSGFSLLPGWGDLVLMVVGLIALLTGIIGFCPAWRVMGINTCPSKTSEAPHSPNRSSEHEHADTTSHGS